METKTDGSGQAFREAAVAFVDILGSKNYMKNEKTALNYIGMLEGIEDLFELHSEGCHIKAFSDNVALYSDDLSPDGVMVLIQNLAKIQYEMTVKFGFFIRGGVAVGELYWKDEDEPSSFIIGKGLIDAYEKESKKAEYPRIIVGEEAVNKIKKIPHWKNWVWKAGNVYFINYLYSTVDPDLDFPDGSKLKVYRKSLRKHVWDDRDMEISGPEWDSIRSKDVWVLAYYNEFCRKYTCEDNKINFTETYDRNEEYDRVYIDRGD